VWGRRGEGGNDSSFLFDLNSVGGQYFFDQQQVYLGVVYPW
jgi:hypothetical protein